MDNYELWKAANRFIVAVDFDNTIAVTRFPEIVEPVPGALHTLLHKISVLDVNLVLWTCREGDYLQQAVEWMQRHYLDRVFLNVPNTNLSERIDFYKSDPRKLGADCFVDDRNVCCPMTSEGYVDWETIYAGVRVRVEQWYKKQKELEDSFPRS